ncbi:MAG: alpha-L-fucosidase [Gemmatimonadales bacterium]
MPEVARSRRNGGGRVAALPRALALAAALTAGATPATLAAEPRGPAAGRPAPTPTRAEAVARFRGARVGLFIHWGIYSLLADGEWVMENRGIRAADYERLAPRFNPTRFDAAAWVSLAQRAGARYLTMTTKHHDGFAMFDTRVSDWDIIERTPFKRDVIAELADACRAADLPLFLYYSQLDWHNESYFPRGGTGLRSDRPEAGDFERYLGFMDAQLQELLTRYGPVAGVWFDGMWDNGAVDWRLQRTYSLIKRLQPQALIGSNHNGPPHDGEDFIPFEGFVRPTSVPATGDFTLEIAEKINDTWGFRIHDRQYKSADSLIRSLVRAAGNDANYLINVGPMADGTIQPEFVERLEAVGRWLEAHGAAIYETRGGPIPPQPWGVTTRRDNTVFLHLFDWPDRLFPLPALGRPVRSARYVGRSGAPRLIRGTAGGPAPALEIEPRRPDEPVLVIALTLG